MNTNFQFNAPRWLLLSECLETLVLGMLNREQEGCLPSITEWWEDLKELYHS